MPKFTYGFPAAADNGAAIAEAVAKARADGFLAEGARYSTEILRTDEHTANNEMCVIIRTEG